MASKDLKQRPGTVKRIGDVFGLFVELEQSEAALVGHGAGHCTLLDLWTT